MPNAHATAAARLAAHLDRKRIFNVQESSTGQIDEGYKTRTCFTDESLKDMNAPDHRIISDILRESGTDEESAYDWTLDYLESIADNEPEDLEEHATEWADETSVYTYDLTAWLNASGKNLYFIDEALSEFGKPESGTALLSLAQMLARREIANAVNAAIENQNV